MIFILTSHVPFRGALSNFIIFQKLNIIGWRGGLVRRGSTPSPLNYYPLLRFPLMPNPYPSYPVCLLETGFRWYGRLPACLHRRGLLYYLSRLEKPSLISPVPLDRLKKGRDRCGEIHYTTSYSWSVKRKMSP